MMRTVLSLLLALTLGVSVAEERPATERPKLIVGVTEFALSEDGRDITEALHRAAAPLADQYDLEFRSMPVPELERAARERRGGRDEAHLLRLSFIGGDVTRPVISECSRRFGVDINILRGTVDDLRGQTVGTLTVLVEGSREVYEQLVDFVRSCGVIVEELSDVD